MELKMQKRKLGKSNLEVLAMGLVAEQRDVVLSRWMRRGRGCQMAPSDES